MFSFSLLLTLIFRSVRIFVLKGPNPAIQTVQGSSFACLDKSHV